MDKSCKLHQDEGKLSGSDNHGKIVYSKLLKGVIENNQDQSIDVYVHFGEEKYYSELLNIRYFLSWISIPSVIIMVIVLIIILSRILRLLD